MQVAAPAVILNQHFPFSVRRRSALAQQLNSMDSRIHSVCLLASSSFNSPTISIPESKIWLELVEAVYCCSAPLSVAYPVFRNEKEYSLQEKSSSE